MKQHLITEERIIEEFKKAIIETLRVDEKSITAESSLTKDLGAESLDFLDINYRLEQTFGMKMARHFILEHIEDMFGEGTAIDENGQLTERAIELLRIRFGEQYADLKPGMDMDSVPALITVRSMARGVLDILDSLPEKCACGASSWKTEDGIRIKCGVCGEFAIFANGDALIKDWLTSVQKEKKGF